MFLPGETFFSAALAAGPGAHRVRRRAARDPGQPDHADRAAARRRLRLAAGELAENARRSASSARSCTSAWRSSPATSTACAAARRGRQAYNRAVGSLESRVLVSARRFKDLGAGSEADVRPLEMIDRNPRQLTLGGVAEGDEEETAPPEADPS